MCGLAEIDERYGLPADTSFAFEVRMDVPDGWPEGVARCPAATIAEDLPVFMKASLSQLLIGMWPEMAYDPSYGGVNSGGQGLLAVDTIENGKAQFTIRKDDTAWAPLWIIPVRRY